MSEKLYFWHDNHGTIIELYSQYTFNKFPTVRLIHIIKNINCSIYTPDKGI